MDDFVTTEILGCMDNQVILPTALRCALRSPQRRELRLKMSKLCVLSANLCALKRIWWIELRDSSAEKKNRKVKYIEKLVTNMFLFW